MNKIRRKAKKAADIQTLGFQIFGFLMGTALGAAVVILIINIVRSLFS